MVYEMASAEIEAVLKNNWVGRIGVAGGGQVYVVPVNFRYANEAVQCFSLEGQKIRMMREHPEVCFEVEEIHDQYNWKTVICHGTFQEITDATELALLRPQYQEYFLRARASVAPDGGATVSNPPGEAIPVYYRIILTEMTGRYQNG